MTGQSDPSACSVCTPGSFASIPGLGLCQKCPKGTFQDEHQATSCKLCRAGYYCHEGSTSPTPCAGGTFGNSTGLFTAAQCLPVEIHFWAPTGSSVPISCPSSGFSCPGARDRASYAEAGIEPPGSQPIPLKVGTIVEEVEVTEALPTITMDLSLEQDLGDFDESRLKTRLADTIGVSSHMIQLELRAGSVLVRVFVAAVNQADQDLLAERVRTLDAVSLTSALGVQSSRVAGNISYSMRNTTYIRLERPPCPRGHW